MDLSRIASYGEPISGPCFDDLHEVCEWPSEPQYVLYCSCICHKEARAVANTRTTTSTSRKPRTAARAASRPAAPRRAAEPDEADEQVSAADAQEIEAEGHYVTAPLCGEDLRIVPPTAWRVSWQRLLNTGQIDAFTELVMHPDDFALFEELDPTIQEWTDFISDASQQAGESLGKSRGPAPSSRVTRRR